MRLARIRGWSVALAAAALMTAPIAAAASPLEVGPSPGLTVSEVEQQIDFAMTAATIASSTEARSTADADNAYTAPVFSGLNGLAFSNVADANTPPEVGSLGGRSLTVA